MPGVGTGPPPKADITPAGNPFPGPDEWERLVYAWGPRNPFRFAIDPATGDVFIGNVGQQLYEEIDFVPGSNYSGNNYGWPQWEGDLPIYCCGTCAAERAGRATYSRARSTSSNTGCPLDRLRSLSSVAHSCVSRPPPRSGFQPNTTETTSTSCFTKGTLHRLQNTGGVWDFAPAVAGQPDAETWADGLWGAADAQLGSDGAFYYLSLGYCCGLARGLYRIVRDPATTSSPEIAATCDRKITVAPNPAVAGAPVTIAFDVEGAATVRVYDVRGRLVRTLREARTTPGPRSIEWDGRADSGESVAAGIYFLRLFSRTAPEGTATITLLP
jgi:hypothetical protein